MAATGIKKNVRQVGYWEIFSVIVVNRKMQVLRVGHFVLGSHHKYGRFLHCGLNKRLWAPLQVPDPAMSGDSHYEGPNKKGACPGSEYTLL